MITAAISLAFALASSPTHIDATTVQPSTAVQVLSPYAQLWDRLDDPVIPQLADELLRNNTDITAVAARLDETRALAGMASAAGRPQVETTVFGSHGNDQVGTTSTERLVRGGLQARWELDLSGRISAERRRADAATRRQSALVEDIRFALLAEMTQQVVIYRKLSRQADDLQRGIKAQDETIALLTTRQLAGLNESTRLELSRGNRAAAAGRLSQLYSAQQDAVYTLERLTGLPAAVLAQRLARTYTLPAPDADWISSISLARLEDRPDVRAASAEVERAYADRDAVQRSYWPRVTLAAFLGVQDGTSGLRIASNPIGNLAATLAAPVITGGARKAQTRAAEARGASAAASLESSLRIALQESQTAINRFSRTLSAHQEQMTAIHHYSETVKLARSRETAGYSDAIEVTEAQRRLYDAELEATEHLAAANLAHIALQRSLGPAR